MPPQCCRRLRIRGSPSPDDNRLLLQMMCDFMAPEGSIYYDAIYGAFEGQRAIRNWLIPTMAKIDFIEFVPTAPPALFDDGSGQTSLDEVGDDRCLRRGPHAALARRQRAAVPGRVDHLGVRCTTPGPSESHRPPDTEINVDAEPIPDWPRTLWQRDTESPETSAASIDFAALGDTFHPTDSVYHDPIFGEIHGRDAIGAWLADMSDRAGNIVYEPLGPRPRRWLHVRSGVAANGGPGPTAAGSL